MTLGGSVRAPAVLAPRARQGLGLGPGPCLSRDFGRGWHLRCVPRLESRLGAAPDPGHLGVPGGAGYAEMRE